MKRVFKNILFVILFTLFLSISCKQTTSEPQEPQLKQDTTSHNFIWYVDTFGIHPSFLRDVYIKNENDIWAVGEIYTEDTRIYDSLGNWIDGYNAIHWNGKEWKFKRVYTISRTIPFLMSINAIWPADQTSWWLAHGQIEIWNPETGENAQKSFYEKESIRSLWSNMSNNVYGVGVNGVIVHYNGESWTRHESSTEIILTDVWGGPEGDIIWACGFDEMRGSVLLRNKGSGFEKVVEVTSPNIPHPPNKITHIFEELWTNNSDSVYLGAIGRVYVAPSNTNGYARELIWWDYSNESRYPPSTRTLKGIDTNDIFVAGINLFIRHYNGKTWHHYEELEGPGSWNALATYKNMVVAVGERLVFDGSIVIARGYRIDD